MDNSYQVLVDFFIYNGKVQAVYFKIKEGKSFYNKVMGDKYQVILDFDKDNNLLGVEMLEPGIVTVSTLQKISEKYHVPELKAFRPKQLINAFKTQELQEAF